MELSDTDLVAFRMRCLMAAERGYLIALAHEYMESLEAEAGGMIAPPDGVEVASAAHLAELAGAVLEIRGGGAKKKGKKDKTPKVEAKEPEPTIPAPVVTPEPKKIPEPEKIPEPAVVEPKVVKVEAPEVPVTEPVKTETVVEVKDAPKEEDVPPYETWTKDALVEEAHARKLQTSSRMTKAEVIELLEADDAKDAGK